MHSLLVENIQIVSAFDPVNLASGANAGDWVSLENYRGVACLLRKNAATAGDDPTITIEQATDASGTGAKAVNFTRVDTKEDADITTVGTFTTVTQAAGNTYTHAAYAEVEAITVIDITEDLMDAAGGFTFVRMSVDDPGTNAQIADGLYLLHGPRYQSNPLPSAIA